MHAQSRDHINTRHTLPAAVAGRGASGLALQMKKTGNENLPIQLQSTVKYDTQMIKEDPSTPDLEVGYKMEAILDPTHQVKGSTPGSSVKHDALMKKLTFHNAGFLRGHLLNNNLGGRGIWRNMFPITKNANAEHLEVVEKHAKTYVIASHQNPGTFVHYNVTVDPPEPHKFYSNPEAKLFGETWLADKYGDVIGDNIKKFGFWSDPAIKIGLNNELEQFGWGSEGTGESQKLPNQRIVETKGGLRVQPLEIKKKLPQKMWAGLMDYREKEPDKFLIIALGLCVLFGMVFNKYMWTW